MVQNRQMILEGDKYSERFSFTQEQVIMFAELSGDNNPLHLDPEYAANTPFKRPIVHGVLAGSVFSKILGTTFPGNGTIYAGQKFTFMRPIYVGVEYEARIEIRKLDYKRNKALVGTDVYHTEDNRIVIRGEATIMHPTKIVDPVSHKE